MDWECDMHLLDLWKPCILMQKVGSLKLYEYEGKAYIAQDSGNVT